MMDYMSNSSPGPGYNTLYYVAVNLQTASLRRSQSPGYPGLACVRLARMTAWTPDAAICLTMRNI